ncbi:hypothetical protein [Kitasatospora sp. NPDC090091]|uniref:hypothetical protein n=1 Tax=Kitasatospora sp. NPDC090091 TaxID=3364081 RepID=UPI003815BBA2
MPGPVAVRTPTATAGRFGRPALIRERGHLRLVAELRPEALESAEGLGAALGAFLDRRLRAYDLVTAALGPSCR